MKVTLKVSQSNPVKLSVTQNPGFTMTLASPIQIIDGEKYEGSYTITPSSETQVIECENLSMRENLVVEPIPSNYGLITWNGSFLMVS